MLKIEHTIREAIGSLEKTAGNVKTAAGAAYRGIASFFAQKNTEAIRAASICPEIFSAQKPLPFLSLHPTAEKEIKEFYQTKFAKLLGIENNKLGGTEESLYAMLLEILYLLDPKQLSPLAIIRFKEALNIYAEGLMKVALGFTEDDRDTFATKAKYPINFNEMHDKLHLLKDILLAAEKKEAAWQAAVAKSDPFIKALEELALVINIKKENTPI